MPGYSCCGTGATLSRVHVQTLGHQRLHSLSNVNANHPFIPRHSHTGSRLQRCGDKDNRLDWDTAEGHGITGPPTARGTLSFNGTEVGELESKAWSWRPVGNVLSDPPRGNVGRQTEPEMSGWMARV